MKLSWRRDQRRMHAKLITGEVDINDRTFYIDSIEPMALAVDHGAH